MASTLLKSTRPALVEGVGSGGSGPFGSALSVEPKQFHDVVGYYNRFDIFDLKVDRSAREPARYLETATPAVVIDSEDTRPERS